MTNTRIPLNLFGIAFGITGLAGTWLAAAGTGAVPGWIGATLLAVGAVVWVITLVIYTWWAARHRSAARSDVTGPITAPFASLALITPLLLVAEGVAPYARTAATTLVDVLIALTVTHGAWFIGQLMGGRYDYDQLHPGYLLPTVAGGLIAAAAAASVGQHRLGQVLFGYGLISWIIMGSMILARLFFRPPLPAAIMPTIAIQVAPAAVASIAYFAVSGPQLDGVAAALAGYGLLMTLAQVRLLPTFLRLHFSTGTWAFAFAWSSVATTALHWIDQTHPTGQPLWTAAVLITITALVGSIATRTIMAIIGKRLLPAVSSPTQLRRPSHPSRSGVVGEGRNHAATWRGDPGKYDGSCDPSPNGLHWICGQRHSAVPAGRPDSRLSWQHRTTA